MKGVVSAGDELTAKAGAWVLENGGNAFDAACACVLAAAMAEPTLTSVGGGGFLLAFESGYDPILYDFFVDVPPNRDFEPDFFPIDVDFGTAIQEFHIGCGSIAVPGVAAGIYRVHEEKGRLPLEDIVRPALKYAKDGVYLSKFQASLIKLLEPIFTSTEGAKSVYGKNGNLIDHTTLFKNHGFAEFLELFAKEGAWAFYEGEVADKIETLSKDKKGFLRKNDLSRYKVEERKPIRFGFEDYEILTNPPPSSGGVLISFALKMLENRDFGKYGSRKHIEKLIESMKVTSDFRKENINEHIHVKGLEEILKDESVMSKFKDSMSKRVNLWGNTTHISVMDSEGNAATVTTSNGEGSGHIIPGCGIMLNNMLGEEDLNPHGFFSWPKYVRLPSMMAPTIVLRDQEPLMVLGSAGSNRIRSAVVQSILNKIIFKKSIQDSVSADRLHYENGALFLEPGFDDEIIKAFEKNCQVAKFNEKNLFFGGVNAVEKDLKGGSDPRRGGSVIVVE